MILDPSKFIDYPLWAKSIVAMWSILTVAIFFIVLFVKPERPKMAVTQSEKPSAQYEPAKKSNNRPTFIKATNVKGLTMKDNTVVGDADFADLDNVTDVKASGNKHITLPNKKRE